MYIRVKTYPNSNKKSVQIVESIRRGSKVSQKIVRHIGVAADDDKLEQLKGLALSIKTRLETGNQGCLFGPEIFAGMDKNRKERVENNKKNKGDGYDKETDSDYRVNLKNLIEEQRTVAGIHNIYGSLFDELGYKKIFKNPARNRSTVNIFKNIVMARIANPQSKMASVDMLEEDFGVTLNLDYVYKMMNKIDDGAIERLNDLTYENTRKLFLDKIDVIFFDCTTVYFESFTEDEFKLNGYSKDLKFNQPQVLIALLVTKEGLPVGYRAFKGDTYEGHTVIPILSELREKYDLDKVIFVADAGLFNKDNIEKLEELEKYEIEYIVGARIKNTSDQVKKEILNKDNYDEIKKGFSMSRFDNNGRQLIVSYSEKRARKDAYDRKKAIDKLKKKLGKQKNPKEYLSNYGYKKYLKVCGAAVIELDKEKIEEAGRWDGLRGVVSNAKKLTNQEILKQYNNLWNVEYAFRITKHDLRVRPIFHWKPRRVKAHLAISFAAYALVKYLEYRVKLQYRNMSPEKIRQTLIRVQTSIFYDTKKQTRYGLPSKISLDAKKIYKLCGITRPQTPYIIKKCSA